MFDKDNSGTISAEEIRAVLSKCGEKLDEAEVDDMVKRADLDGDGLISYEGIGYVPSNNLSDSVHFVLTQFVLPKSGSFYPV